YCIVRQSLSIKVLFTSAFRLHPSSLLFRAVHYVDERANGYARRTFRAIRLGVVAPCRSGNIKVCPRSTVSKLFQERSGCYSSGLAPADVFDVRYVRLDL